MQAREVHVKIRVDIDPAENRYVTNMLGRRRKAFGLRLEYSRSRSGERMDIAVELEDEAFHFAPAEDMPQWMRDAVLEFRPAALDSLPKPPRTGMGGWPVPEPAWED